MCGSRTCSHRASVPDHQVAVVGAVGRVDAAVEVLRPVGGRPGAHHRRARVPGIVVDGTVDPGAEDDVPAIVIVRQVGLFQEGVDRREAEAHRRLPVVVRRVLVDQHLIGIDGNLRRLLGQQHLDADAAVGLHLDRGRRVVDVIGASLRHDRDADGVALTAAHGEAQRGLLVDLSFLAQHYHDARFALGVAELVRPGVARSPALQPAAKVGFAAHGRRLHRHAVHGPVGQAGAVEPVAEELVPRIAGVRFQLAAEVGHADDAVLVAAVNAGA